MEDNTRVDVFLGGKKIVSGILVDITNAGFSFFNEVPQIAITLIPCPETLSAGSKEHITNNLHNECEGRRK